ncbi:MAG: hypothetical protein V1838_01400, partial [Patescibacteria group bacterium]
MKNKILFTFVALAGIIGATVLVSQAASAHGWLGGGKNIEVTAENLGLSVDELKSKLESQSLGEVAQEQGVTLEELKAQAETKHAEQLQKMGYTDEEINTINSARDIQQSKMLEYKAEFLGIS